jgi:hypothetical protein
MRLTAWACFAGSVRNAPRKSVVDWIARVLSDPVVAPEAPSQKSGASAPSDSRHDAPPPMKARKARAKAVEKRPAAARALSRWGRIAPLLIAKTGQRSLAHRAPASMASGFRTIPDRTWDKQTLGGEL